ncbi:MAG: phosphotransferase [Nitrosomonas sp.]|uniref:aminoglycoside phosphotransferase family protein n=1 Tax=Nitrosomonas sp. TaxID=42353 RepID=UPI0027336301|nr:phosphotransferase [Nitrosomonas sp.]MDP3282536.1 phosphotransferase [Nitrosomonas sp.]MDP3662440.1 phosphotransferase [Nitrosomonas sp.]MDZ4105091.1 phosphotransferase [Nitrosomonas sp.]
MERIRLLENWVKEQFPEKPFTLQPASADASFRRYFRVSFKDQTLIAMDAPPQQEDCTPFIQVAKILAATGVHVPKIVAKNLDQGFLLLSDLGDTTFLQALNNQMDSADQLYGDAIDALIKLQLSQQVEGLPGYDEALLLKELNLFPDWYVAKHLRVAITEKQQAVLQSIFTRIIQNNIAQPQVLVHRDYHSRNLMVTSPNPGIIDFQDAVMGPITYDLVSLFKDAYIRWDEERILDWMIRYWEKARKAGLPVPTDFAEFYRDFEWMGVQRHIKILGVFTRLYYRDGKESYLNDLPLVMEYLRKTCKRYRELHLLLNLLDELNPAESDQKIGYTF